MEARAATAQMVPLQQNERVAWGNMGGHIQIGHIQVGT